MEKLVKNVTFEHPGLYYPVSGSECSLSIITDGYYTRRNNILQTDYTCFENGEYIKHIFKISPDSVSDEYEIIKCCLNDLSHFDKIITYNGNSYTLPFLKTKADIYDICYNIDNESTLDLYILFKSLYHLLGTPSRKLTDYLNFLGYKESGDSEDIIKITGLMPYLGFLDHGFRPITVSSSGDNVIFDVMLNTPVPKKISYRSGPFYIILEDCIGKVSAKKSGNDLKMFHSDYKNYDFLPKEGYAVHKSISSFLIKGHKEKATRDTAYSLVALNDRFLSDPVIQYDYLVSVIEYIKGGL